jgi:hypothetical protein
MSASELMPDLAAMRRTATIFACASIWWSASMLDAIFLAIGLGFFAAGCLYLYACDRL